MRKTKAETSFNGMQEFVCKQFPVDVLCERCDHIGYCDRVNYAAMKLFEFVHTHGVGGEGA